MLYLPPQFHPNWRKDTEVKKKVSSLVGPLVGRPGRSKNGKHFLLILSHFCPIIRHHTKQVLKSSETLKKSPFQSRLLKVGFTAASRYP